MLFLIEILAQELYNGYGSCSEGTGNSEIKLSQNDSASILALRKLFSVYEVEYNSSGMDATMRAIQEIQQRNGVDVENYTFANMNKTTRVSIDRVQTFTLDDIHNLHKNDDRTSFLSGAMPGIGAFLGPLYSTVSEKKQKGENSFVNTLKNIVIAVVGDKNYGAGLVVSGVDTGISMGKDKNDTYNRDGITIKENDTYILLRTETNQGLDVATIKVYVRDGELISYQQFGPYTTLGSHSYNEIIKSKWKEAGYK